MGILYRLPERLRQIRSISSIGRLVVLALAIAVPNEGWTAPVATPISSDLPALIAAHGAALAQLASDDDARRLSAALGDADAAPLAAELSAWQLATALREAAERADGASAAALLPARERNIAWLLAEQRRPLLAKAVNSSRAVAAMPVAPPADDKAVLQWLLNATRAEAQAERTARQELDRVRMRHALARLCGTWQWTIHNHRNHQDHKTMMVFPPPDGAATSGAKLTSTIVNGDTVYLRWDFPGGYQEESLLFAAEGQRVEGTFINSAGAWGSITGKRTAACKPGAQR